MSIDITDVKRRNSILFFSLYIKIMSYKCTALFIDINDCITIGVISG